MRLDNVILECRCGARVTPNAVSSAHGDPRLLVSAKCKGCGAMLLVDLTARGICEVTVGKCSTG
jgi:hypothetical protein